MRSIPHHYPTPFLFYTCILYPVYPLLIPCVSLAVLPVSASRVLPPMLSIYYPYFGIHTLFCGLVRFVHQGSFCRRCLPCLPYSRRYAPLSNHTAKLLPSAPAGNTAIY